MLGPLGLFQPLLRELPEMRFTWDQPYHVDASKFTKAFWGDPTPFEIGVPATALSFQEMARDGARLTPPTDDSSGSRV